MSSLYRFLYPYRWSALGALIALVFTAVITLAFGQGVRVLIDNGFAYLNQAIFLFFGLILLLGMGSFLRFFLVSSIGERIVADLRQSSFQHLLYLPISFFEKESVGELQSRVMTDTTVIQQFISSSLSAGLRNAFIFLGALVFLFIENTTLTVIAFLGMSLILVPLLVLGRKIKKTSKDNQQAISKASGFLNESLHYIKTVQAFNQQDKTSRVFASQNQNILKEARYRIILRGLLTALVIVLVLSAVLGLLWLGAHWVISGDLTAGELAAFLFYAVLAASSAGTLSESFSEWQQVKGALDRVFDLLNIPETPHTKIVSTSRKIKPLEISIKNLSFAYAPLASEKVLNNISLHIAAGESIGIVGPSGAGKSTLLELLLGFYDVQPGSIFLDEQDITFISQSNLREQIAWVPQHPAVFSTSLWENVCYSNSEASDEMVENAIEAAYVNEFALNLPERYKTVVGEGAALLSGGQAQRIGLARAFLKKPQLMLLDEPTSALDAISEKMIQQSLKNIMQTCTTIIVAHRLATVKMLSRIVVMDEGKIIAMGTHEELLRSCALYAELARLQFIGVTPDFSPDIT